MCDCYGSHVLRSLLCLCRGVPLDSSEIHATKSSILLAERLNVKMSQPKDNNLQHLQPRFPELLKLLVSGILDTMQKDMGTFQANQYSSLVLQASFIRQFKFLHSTLVLNRNFKSCSLPRTFIFILCAVIHCKFPFSYLFKNFPSVFSSEICSERGVCIYALFTY